jgi:hypothetical protein
MPVCSHKTRMKQAITAKTKERVRNRATRSLLWTAAACWFLQPETTRTPSLCDSGDVRRDAADPI